MEGVDSLLEPLDMDGGLFAGIFEPTCRWSPLTRAAAASWRSMAACSLRSFCGGLPAAAPVCFLLKSRPPRSGSLIQVAACFECSIKHMHAVAILALLGPKDFSSTNSGANPNEYKNLPEVPPCPSKQNRELAFW